MIRWSMSRLSRATAQSLILPASLCLALTLPQGAIAQEDGETIELSTSSDAAKMHFWAGMEDAHNVYGPGAVRHFEQAIAADPGWGIAHVMRAQIAVMPNDERLEEIGRGIAQMGDATDDELLMAAAVRAFRTGNGAEASRMIETLRRNNPGDPYATFWAAQTAAARGSQMNPGAMWERVIEDFPDYAPSYNMLAYARLGMDDRSGAMEAVQDYLRHASDHPNAHDSYAEMLQASGRYADALTHYGHAAERAEDYDAAHTGMAETYVLMGEYEEAARHMEAAAEITESPATRVNDLRGAASAYMLGGDRSAAMEALAAAAEAATDDGAAGFAHLQMALTAGMMGRGGDVAGHLAQAATLGGGDNPGFHGMSAMAHAAAGHGDEAREAASHIPEGNAFWTDVGRSARALSLVEDGDPQGAMEVLRDADGTNPMVQAVMAEALDELDRDPEAEALRSDVLNLRTFNLANPFIAASRYLAMDS
ncbi:MAG TPA: tetratricopeptide repeat protein [Longimicrobiales bacterium]|nr:tetratricopeptide repeat protein [Longimicrobiales bacterium]